MESCLLIWNYDPTAEEERRTRCLTIRRPIIPFRAKRRGSGCATGAFMCSLCDLFLLYFLVIFARLSRISPVRYFSAGRFAPLPGADGEADRRRFPARRRAEAVCRERRRRNPQEERKTGVISGRWSGWRLAAIVEA